MSAGAEQQADRVAGIEPLLPLLYSQLNLDDLAAHVVKLLSALVPNDMTAYAEVNPELGRSISALDSPEAQADAVIYEPVFERYMHQHPLICHMLAHPDSGVHKISDFLALEQWRKTDLHHHFFKPIGIDHQIVLPIDANLPNLTAVTINRARQDFTEAERSRLECIRPHIVQAYRNASQFTALKRTVSSYESSLEALGIGLICLNDRHGIESMTDYAAHCLRALYRNDRHLPDIIVEWLDSHDGLSAPATLHIQHDDDRLRCRLLPNRLAEHRLVSIERYLPLSGIDALRELGISRREADILYWLSQGKSNSEIAITLHISPRTVTTHLDRIYRKLGVNSRSAAAVMAVERLVR